MNRMLFKNESAKSAIFLKLLLLSIFPDLIEKKKIISNRDINTESLALKQLKRRNLTVKQIVFSQ